MIKIYCLVNPLTGLPFYVGATKNKLAKRLACHCYDHSFSPINDGTFHGQKSELFFSLKKQGLTPLIYLLFITNKSNADICEEYFYNYFTSQGIDLMQSSYNFVYSKKNKSK